MTNADMEKVVETNDEWITSRTGIRERRIAGEHEHTSDLAAQAGRIALEQAGVAPTEVDLILVATASPDMFFPATACLVQSALGARKAACMDISAACSGFLYAIEMARHMIAGGAIRYALIIGAEKLSAMVDWTDRNTCVLFGDGAGAAVLGPRPAGRAGQGVLSTLMGSDGNYADILGVPGGASRCPVTAANLDQRLNTIKMVGKETFKQAVSAMTSASIEVLATHGPVHQRHHLHHPPPGERADHRRHRRPPEGGQGPVLPQPGEVRQHGGGGGRHRARRSAPGGSGSRTATSCCSSCSAAG